jgi:hypothetical protein
MLSGCSGPSAAAPTATIEQAASPVAPSATAAPTTVSQPTARPGPTFQPVTYRDETGGFEFDHPAGWTVGPIEQFPRGGITAFTSWERPADVLPGETPPGETRLDATVQLWEPVNDLEAFVETRRLAWEASDIHIVSQEEWALGDDRAAQAFIVEGSEGARAYFFFTTLEDKYLVLSGDGDLMLLAEIAHTVRPIPPGS